MRLNKKMWLILIVLILAVSAAAIIYMTRYDPMFRRVSDSEPSAIYSLDGTKQNYFDMLGDQLLIVNNDGVNAINGDGSIRFSVSAYTSEPILRTASKYILIADRRGRDARLIADGNIQASVTASSEIVSCSVSESGMFVLVTTEDGYRNKIVLYNPNGEEEYVWKVASNYVVDACVSNDGKKLIASMVSANDNELLGGVAFADVDSQTIGDPKLEKDKIIVRLGFVNNDTLVAVGENLTEGYDKNGNLLWTVDYNGRQLQTFALEAGKELAMAFDNSANNSRIEVYSTTDGRLRGGSDLDFEITSIDLVADVILATGARCLGVFGQNGAERIRYNSERELRYGGLMGNKSEAYIIGGTTVELLKP